MIEFDQRKEIKVGQRVFVNIPNFHKENYANYLCEAIQNGTGTITEIREDKIEEYEKLRMVLMERYFNPLRTGWKCYVKFDDENVEKETLSNEWMIPFCHLELMK
jgi:hypothetical protein